MKLNAKVGGRYKLIKHKAAPDGTVIPGTSEVVADWFPNLITDQGLELMGSSSTYLSFCQVGSGNATPTVSDTGLQTWVAGTDTQQSSATSGSFALGYRGYVRTMRFAAGVAAGNLQEIGMGTAASGPTLYSRALIVDSGGNPTTITVLPDEILDVVYEHRVYWPEVDGGGVINISGVNYTYVTRAVAVTTSNNSFSGYGWGTFGTGAFSGIRGYSFANGVAQSAAYDGALVAPNASQPTGTIGSSSSASSPPYVPGSLTRQGTLTWNVGNANFATGISAVKVGFGWCSYQISFDPPIPKNNTQELSLTFTHSWSRATIP
jgi:hypothetical protein